MFKKTLSVGPFFLMLCSLAACGAAGQQDTRAETMANEAGTVRLELVSGEGEQTENE